jgi:DNA-binding HxlR family transcriptional regulator
MRLLKVIAKTGCCDVLLKLSEHDELNFGDIAKLMEYRQTTTRVLKELRAAGLLERRVLEDRSVKYKLSEKGKAISKILKEIKETEAAFELPIFP